MRNGIVVLCLLTLLVWSTAWADTWRHNGKDYNSEAEVRQAINPNEGKVVIDAAGAEQAKAQWEAQHAQQAKFDADTAALAARAQATEFNVGTRALTEKVLRGTNPNDPEVKKVWERQRQSEIDNDASAKQWGDQIRANVGSSGPISTTRGPQTLQGTPVGLSGFDSPAPTITQAVVHPNSPSESTATAAAPKPTPVAYKPAKALVSFEKTSGATQK